MAEVQANTPVLVGVSAVQQKIDDYRQALEPVALMERALRAAAEDAGSAELLIRANEILVPKSMWGYSDPGRLLAEAVGARHAKTLLAEFGILQQSLLTRACQRIASGEVEVVLVTGGEARYRAMCAAKAADRRVLDWFGSQAPETVQTDVEPDITLRPEEELWSAVESDSGLGMPVGYYAILDSALRFKQGLSVAAHRDQMARMYATLSELAVDNPDAWSDQTVTEEMIREHSPENRMLAFPYTKLHNSQWNVDQAAGLILCSAQCAQELGVPRDKWVFPLAAAESNFMSVVASRRDLGASPGFRIAGQVAMKLAGVSFNEIRLCELYSCFPYAIRVQLQEFGMNPQHNVSVTGGMSFGGGPLNNFVFQSLARMVKLLRQNPKEIGLVSAVSGLLTKQACALWSATPGVNGWVCADVTDEVREASELCELVAKFNGAGVVAGYTVLYQGQQPWRAVAVFDLPDGRRTVAYNENPEQMASMMTQEYCGKTFQLAEGKFQ
jgi:acetyl-CoA C-acetyltransferase